MKIQVEIGVYPDGEYCECKPDDKSGELCNYLNTEEENCFLFGKDLNLSSDSVQYEKCDQCKDAYQKAKLEETADSIVIDGYRFDCQKHRLFFNNRVEAVLICDKAEKKRIQNMLESKQSVAISSHDGFEKRIGSIEAIGLFPAANGNNCIHVISRSK